MAGRHALGRAAAGLPQARRSRRRPDPRGARHRQELRRHQGRAGRRHRGARPQPARADRPERRRQDHRLQPDLRHVRAGRGRGAAARPLDRGLQPGGDHARPGSAAPSRSPTCSRRSRSRRTCGSRSRPATRAASIPGRDARALADIEARDRSAHPLSRRRRHRAGRGRRALLWRPAPSRHGRSRSRRSRALLLLDEPLAGLAAAERQRIGDIIKRISADVPVLLVEHDIDRVFQIADAVTVMNEGKVLVDGTVEDARSSPRVQEVYIGSGAATRRRQAPRERGRAGDPACRSRTSIPTTARATSWSDVSFDVHSTRSWRCSAATAPASRRC